MCTPPVGMRKACQVDVHAKVAQLRSLVASARAMPMSASCVISRPDVLEHIDELATMLRDALDEADRVVSDRVDVVASGRAEAEQIVADAYVEQEKLASDTDVFRIARRAADQLLDEARAEAAALRRDTDDYIDERLAGLELSLRKTLDAVNRGRSRLQGRSELDELHLDGAAPLPDPFAT